MDITVLQENIGNALTIAGKFLPTKLVTLPLLSNILLSATTDAITITASDLETTIQIEIPGKVNKPGDVLIPAKNGVALLSSFTGEKLHIFASSHNITIESDSSKGTLRIEEVGDFPRLAPLQGSSVAIDKKILDQIDRYVYIAASTDQARAVLTGIYIHVEDGTVSFVASDGFRLALLQTPSAVIGTIPSLLIPAKVIHGIVGVLKQQDEKGVQVVFDTKQNIVFFTCGRVQLTTRVIDGSFPDYNRIIPADSIMSASVSREDLLRAVKFASVMAQGTAHIIRIGAPDADHLKVSANSPQAGKNESLINASVSGEFVEAAFNYKYLIDLLSSSNSDRVIYETKGSLSPGVFTFPDKKKYWYIVMPVRLQDAT